MPTYFIGILSELAEPIFHGWANIFDNYLSNKIFKSLAVYIFFSIGCGILFLPIVLWLSPPSLLPLNLLGLIFVVACIDVVYLYPYFWSLRSVDTSVVASLFSLGKVLVPILAFFILGERLAFPQYAGFFIIIASSVVLTFEPKKMRLSRAFLLMLFVSFILAFETILLKYVFIAGASWGSVVCWGAFFRFGLSGLCIFWPSAFRELPASRASLKKVWPLFLMNEASGWFGNMGNIFALSLIPASVVAGLSSTQPIFVLIYALIFHRKYPALFREYLEKDGVLKKSICYTCMIAGTLLVAFA